MTMDGRNRPLAQTHTCAVIRPNDFVFSFLKTLSPFGAVTFVTSFSFTDHQVSSQLNSCNIPTLLSSKTLYIM